MCVSVFQFFTSAVYECVCVFVFCIYAWDWLFCVRRRLNFSGSGLKAFSAFFAHLPCILYSSRALSLSHSISVDSLTCTLSLIHSHTHIHSRTLFVVCDIVQRALKIYISMCVCVCVSHTASSYCCKDMCSVLLLFLCHCLTVKMTLNC